MLYKYVEFINTRAVARNFVTNFNGNCKKAIEKIDTLITWTRI